MHLDERQSYVTLATNEEYAIGALVLGYSLRLSKTDKELTILITEGVPHNFRILLEDVFDHIVVVKPIRCGEEGNLNLFRRPDLEITHTKLYCWKLIEFSKCVFLDADTIVLQNIDELFQREELSAAPDTSWPDIFNSGVFVYRPSLETFHKLALLGKTMGSFAGGDQGLLNEYFNTWSTDTLDKHLLFTYNCSCWELPNDNLMFYTRPPAWKKFGSQVKVAHFAGFEKPWKHRFAANNEAVCQAIDRLEALDTVYTTAEPTGVLALWWAIFFTRVQHHLRYGIFLSTTFGPSPLPSPSAHDNRLESQEFCELNGNSYHPEFHDTSFDFLHTGQRVDESNRYQKFHEVFEHPKPPVAEHYETQRYKTYDHQSLPPPSPQQSEVYLQEYPHQHYEGNRYKELNAGHHEQEPYYERYSQCEYALPSSPHAPMERPFEQHDDYNREGWHHPSPRQRFPSQHREPSSSPPELQNDKDHLFFAKKSMCRECLRELQWGQQFVDPFHRNISTPVSPTYTIPRIRRHSQRMCLSGRKQIVRGVLKKPSTPPTFTIPKKDILNTKAKGREKSLLQGQYGKFVPQKCLKKPLDQSNHGDATKRRIQAKAETLSPQASLPQAEDKKLPKPIEKIKTALSDNQLSSKIKNSIEQDKQESRMLPEIASAPILKSILIKRRSEVNWDSRLAGVEPILGTFTPPASVTRSKRQTKPLNDSERAAVEALIRVKIARAAAAHDKRLMTQSETEEVFKPKACPKLELDTGSFKAIETSSIKALKSKGLSLPEPEEAKASQEQIADERLQNISKSNPVEDTASRNLQLKDYKRPIDTTEAVPEPVVARSVVDLQQFSGEEYFCDRHRPHPSPPEWKMFAWERGEIDYMGSDRFSNILARIRSTIQQSEDDALLIGVWL